jgi:L-ascorbate metabolism protein UlaG (beta-lactamase superfamily)
MKALMQFQLIRSATVKISAAGCTLLVDPYLAPRGGGKTYAGAQTSPLVELPQPLEEILRGVNAVFVSHLHSDHFDATAQQQLPRELPLLCPEAIAAPLRTMGFEDVTGIGSTLAWRGCTLHLTGGRHGPDEVLQAMGEVHGFVLRAPGEPLLYWAGDTVWCAEVQAALQHFDPAVVVVHACGATWRGLGPLVMDAEQVQAVLQAAPRSTVVATHLDTVDHATVSRADLSPHFATLPDLGLRLRIPADGQVMDLQARP